MLACILESEVPLSDADRAAVYTAILAAITDLERLAENKELK
jgi:hypothetical protein